MQRTKLGEQYVRFTVDGLKESEAAVSKTAQKNEVTWGNMAKTISAKFRTAMAGVFAVAAPAAGLLGFARAASQGTQEGDRMATAWTYLSQVVGQMFAPAMRTATQIVVRVADAIANLSPATKTWIVAVSLASAGLLALAGVVTVASVAFTGLAAAAGIAWAIVTAPIVLTIAAIVAVIGVVGLLVGAFVEGGNSIEGTMAGATRSWVKTMLDGIKFLTTKLAEFFNWVARQTGKLFSFDPVQIDINGLDSGMESFAKAVDRAVPKFGEISGKAAQIVGNLRGVPGLLGDLLKSGGMKFTAQTEVKFESLQGTFDRLQESFAKGPEEDKLNLIREEGKKTNELLDKILDKIGVGGLIGV